METTTTTTQVAKPPSLKPNQVLITGRIDSVRTFDSQGRRTFEHRVVLPAVDQYTSPSYVLVQAPLKLGSPGEDVKVICHVGGFRDRFKTKDGEFVETARMFLRAAD
jgi:hypothetical protein